MLWSSRSWKQDRQDCEEAGSESPQHPGRSAPWPVPGALCTLSRPTLWSPQQENAREGPSERMLSVSITRPDLSHPFTARRGVSWTLAATAPYVPPGTTQGSVVWPLGQGPEGGAQGGSWAKCSWLCFLGTLGGHKVSVCTGSGVCHDVSLCALFPKRGLRKGLEAAASGGAGVHWALPFQERDQNPSRDTGTQGSSLWRAVPPLVLPPCRVRSVHVAAEEAIPVDEAWETAEGSWRGASPS